MPHESPWLDDPIKRREAEILAQQEKEAEVIRIQNQAMRTVLNECPYPIRDPGLCETCGNEPCFKAWKEQNKLWNEPQDIENQKVPASVASSAESFQERTQKLFAKCRNSQEPATHYHRSDLANGLFGDDQEKAA